MSFTELATRLAPEEQAKHLNEHLEPRMFLVGHAITAADVIALAHLLEYFVRVAIVNTF